MELRKQEYDEIKTLWSSWLSLKDTELEAVVGKTSSGQWMDVMMRLRELGLQEEVQIPYLNIQLQNGMRFQITGEDAVKEYCKTNRLPESVVCTIKTKIPNVQPLDINEYDVRIKVRREQPLSREDIKFQEVVFQWSILPKTFRYIRRYSFSTPKGSGARFDLSIVRQSFNTMKSFTEADVLGRPITYEVEVEALRDEAGIEPIMFLGKIGHALQGKQRSFAIIRNSLKLEVEAGLKEVFGQNNKFPGPKAVTLEKKNISLGTDGAASSDTISLLTLKGGYNVTDKADGLRVMLYVHVDGSLYLVDMNMDIYRTGMAVDPAIWAGTVLDGEWVRKTKTGDAHNTFYAFDIFRTRGGKDCRPFPFSAQSIVQVEEGAPQNLESRYKLLSEAVSGISLAKPTLKLPLAHQLSIAIKNFKFANPGSPQKQIFVEAKAMLEYSKSAPYSTDGLIFTPNALALPMTLGTWKAQFKWKPVSHNTVDFLCVIERNRNEKGEMTGDEIVRTELRSDTNELVSYKTLRLFVGSVRDPAFKNPRQTVLEMLPLPSSDSDDYKPIVFYPLDPPDITASICHVPIDMSGAESDISHGIIRTVEDAQPISSNMVIEMSYNPDAGVGWRWIPMRVRWDKTESYRRGKVGGSLNAEKVADSVWASIHDPITEEMVTTGEGVEEEGLEAGAEAPTAEKVYVSKVDSRNEFKVKGLRDFHNYIKSSMLFSRILQSGMALVDIGCGKAGDIHKWSAANLAWVLGIDPAEDSLNNPRDGAYRRYVNKRLELPTAPPMVFVQGSAIRPFSTGDAGITQEDQTMLRALFNSPLGGAQPPKFLIESGLIGRAAQKFEAVSCMFALHYFFERAETVEAFLHNLSDCLKVGGFFIGCCFDGETVFNSLASLKQGGVLTGKEEETEVWSITKQYDSDPEELALPSTIGGVGRAIDVNFITIGDNHREYLVNFDFLRGRLADLGIDLLLPEEMATLKLKESTGMFKKVYDGVKNRFGMAPKIRDFSFLNRWFIFRRRSYGPLSTATQGEPVLVSEGLGIQGPVEPIILPILPPSVSATRGRGAGAGRGRGGLTRGGIAQTASVPAVQDMAPPLVVELSRGRGRGSGLTRGRGRGAAAGAGGGNRVTIDL